MSVDNMTLLSGLLNTIFGGGLILAFIAWRKQKQQEPIDNETAAVVNAKTAGELALAVAREAASSNALLRSDLVLVKQKQLETEIKLATLEALFSGVITWIRDLHIRWDDHRKNPEPPGGLPPGVIL